MTDTPVPTYLGMVMCDNIIQDPETKKHYLLGTATVTFARSFPARYPKMCVYAALTGLHDRTKFTVRIVHVDPGRADDIDVMSIEGAVDAPDPLAVAELTIGLHNLMFPRPGEYRFQLWTGDTLLGERKFHVRQITTDRPT
ncbi:MAG: DUF6941 family protein [Planctomycetota bacterium]|jgi:hypothetical protein